MNQYRLASCMLLLVVLASSGCSSLTSSLRNDSQSVESPSALSIAGQQKPLGSPENQELQIALETARLAEERGMDTDAIAAYEEVRRLNPKQPGVSHALAVLYDRGLMTDSAQKEYSAALQEAPNDANVHCDYGYFLYSTGRLFEAEESLRRAINLDANHQKSTVNLAVVLASQAKFDEAQFLFEKAIGPAAALHNIGMFQLRHGNTAVGQQLITAALEKDPSLQQSMAVLENLGRTQNSSRLAAGSLSLPQ
ncbi:MAG: tetratricopeptide repeat protein [Planctomycetota bacterium]